MLKKRIGKIYQLILWLAIIGFAVFFSYLAIRRYQTLNSHYYDLGIMNQVVYNTSRGKFLDMTNQQLGRNVNRIAIHFDPILAAFAPLYKVYASPEVLLVSQAIIIALGALAVFLIAKKIIKKNGISFLFSLSYLFYFPIQRVVIFDFHAVALATTFFLFAIYFEITKKDKLFFLFLLLALLTKEHVGLVMMFYGAYIFFFRKEKKKGVVVSLLGAVFFVVTVYFLIPYFRQSTHFAMRYFEEYGSTPSSIVLGVFRYPMVFIRSIFRQEIYDYVIRMISPMALSLFSPFTLLIAAPEWAINILSLNTNMRAIYFHYNSLIIPFLFYASIMGYAFLAKKIKNKFFINLVIVAFLLLNIRSAYLYNPVPSSLVRLPVGYKDMSVIKKKSLEKWIKKLEDENIAVATTPKLAPFFTNRFYYFNFLFDPAYASMGLTEEDVIKEKIHTYKKADYVIIDRDEISPLGSGELTEKFYVELISDREYERVFSDDQNDKSFEVYKKIINIK